MSGGGLEAGTPNRRPSGRHEHDRASPDALHRALLKHGVEHEYYVGGHGGHDWATWRHLLHERFLPGLWRSKGPAAPEKMQRK
jgi:S-formylglutathione hydrolase FrmB